MNAPKIYRMDKDYTYMYGHVEHHGEPKDLNETYKLGFYNFWLGLFYKGEPVGSGRLARENKRKKEVHSENMVLEKGFRRKGHGIRLYQALLLAAKHLGVKRVYSSQNLNKLSTRMWRVKLARDLGYVVVEMPKNCTKPCKHCRQESRFYTDIAK